MVVLTLLGCSESDVLVRTWHRSFTIARSASAEDTEGDCDPDLERGVDQPYGFLAVSVGLPDIASLYLCEGPAAEDCPSQPIGNVWIREWTERRLVGEVGVNTLFGDLCTISWNGIDAERTDDGALHVELRAASREVQTPKIEDCDEALEAMIRSTCDTVLTLDGEQL